MARRLPPGVHGPRADGRFYASVELTPGPDGRRRRRYVYGASPREAADRLAALARQVHDGELPEGPAATVGQWLDHWLATAVVPHKRPRTVEMYRWAVERARPHLGGVPLAKLTPEHLEHAYLALAADGLGPRSVGIVHARLRTALQLATDRRRIPRNPALQAVPPSVPYREMAALEGDEVPRVLAAAAASERGARWIFALAMGARSGEVLGLTWDRLDIDYGDVDLARQLLRIDARHGDACRCEPKTRVGRCPSKVAGGWALVDVKSAAGRRKLPLPAELVPILREHRARQVALRLALGSAWKGSDLGDLVFPTATGTPMHRSVDRKGWLAVLDAAGVRRVRVHDARHTAATVMLEQGIDVKVVSAWLGHTSTQLTSNVYQHVTARLEQDAAARVGAALWPSVGG